MYVINSRTKNGVQSFFMVIIMSQMEKRVMKTSWFELICKEETDVRLVRKRKCYKYLRCVCFAHFAKYARSIRDHGVRGLKKIYKSSAHDGWETANYIAGKRRIKEKENMNWL